MPVDPGTIAHARQGIREQLQQLKLSEAQVQAETALLLASATGLTDTQLWMQADSSVSREQWTQLHAWLAQRCKQRVPVQYLLGEAWFYGHRFAVSPAVLIPRPETEVLIETALRRIQQLVAQHQRPIHVIDIGTGSGCIAISLSLALGTHVAVSALDVSSAALAIAQQNAETLGATITFMEQDLLKDGLPTGHWDVIVSNPPYIPPKDYAELQPEVLNHEPRLALEAEANGLAFYQTFHQKTPPNTWLLCEFGQGHDGVSQQEALTRLFQGWDNVRFVQDGAGLPRVMEGYRP